jgi:hypothetical protein
LKITNFYRNYGDSFRSLNDLSEKIRSIENGNGQHHDHNRDGDDDNHHHHHLYPGIKLPSKDFVISLILDNPGITKDKLVKIMLHRMHMRYHFGSKFKNTQLAKGLRYELDEMEEYDVNQLDVEEIKILQQQRERRKQKGRILSIEEYGSKGGVAIEVGRDMPDNTVEPLTDSEMEYYWLQPNSRWQDPNYHW